MIDKLAVNIDAGRQIVKFTQHAKLLLPVTIEVPFAAVLSVAGHILVGSIGNGSASSTSSIVIPKGPGGTE